MTGNKYLRILIIALMIVSIIAASSCITITAPDIGNSGQSGEPENPPTPPPTPTPDPTPPPVQEPKQKPNIELFDASPDSINPGQMATLTWSVTGAQTVSIDNGIGPVALVGSRTLQPAASTTYTLTATNAAGSVTSQAFVTVIAAPTPGNPVVEFTAVHMGGTSWQLNWNVIDSTERVIEPEIGAVPPTGSTMVTVPSGQIKTYRLTATKPGGWFMWHEVTLISP